MSEKEWSRSWSKSSESARADSENEHSAPDTGAEWCDSSDGKPSDETIRSSLTDVREEIERARRLVRSPENAFTCALGALAALERRIVALRESLGDESPRETENSSSKEEELILVRSVKGVDKEGRLILGDPKLLRASALKS